MFDKILERSGLKYEDLNAGERETLNSWISAMKKGVVTVSKMRSHISSMKDSVEKELTKTDHNTKQDIFLKARLRNYLLLESFLTTPERAREQMEQAIASFSPAIDKK